MWRVVAEFFWPRGGWGRAAQYVKHRVRRLPDTPQKISRGIWAGIFICFTPFYGLHFIMSGLLAWAMRGNVIAALMATFFGNPFTFPPIAALSVWLGRFLLGMDLDPKVRGDCATLCQFSNAAEDLWSNIKAIFSPARMEWDSLTLFYNEVFYPYLIGGLIPGILSATIAYYLCVSVIQAYQDRRRKRLRAKLAKLKNPADDL